MGIFYLVNLWFNVSIMEYRECGVSDGLFYNMIGVELFFFIVFVINEAREPLDILFMGEGEGGGAAHVCVAHSFIELMMVCITFCVFVHFPRVASCSSVVSCWISMKFSSLNLLRKAWIFCLWYCVYELGGCVGW